MLLFSFLLADTPANCVQDQFYGVWEFYAGVDFVKVEQDAVQCPKDFNSSLALRVELKERGVAVTTESPIMSGRWTPVANQGFEVRLNGQVYFFFSGYREVSPGVYESLCKETSAGWSHPEGLMQQKSMRCASAKLIEPAVSDIVPIAGAYEDPDGKNLWVGSKLPTNFSWRSVNGKSYVPPVFDQESCGSCFAAASTQAMMARVMVATDLKDPLGQTEFLSVQQVVDCNQYSQGCDGGFGEQVAKFAEDFGILTVKGYKPYVAKEEDCTAESAKEGETRYHFTGYTYLGGYFGADNTVESMQWELYRYGPFPVSVYVDTQKTEENTTYSDWKACKRTTTANVKPVIPSYPELTPEQQEQHDGRHYYLKKSNHLVLLTGFGTDKEGDYWEIMNSWGDWCENGYIRIRRGTNEYNVESAPITFYYAGKDAQVPKDSDVLLSQTGFGVLVGLCVFFGVAALVAAGFLIFMFYQKKSHNFQKISNE